MLCINPYFSFVAALKKFSTSALYKMHLLCALNVCITILCNSSWVLESSFLRDAVSENETTHVFPPKIPEINKDWYSLTQGEGLKVLAAF